ncbi:MAG: Zn-ribbon domain-containing OB-fold protein [Aigarchaeota archaeon]|nr:Zn-ribbon domain-containing OB-fold protein [Aigarchaeota archaeon]MDW8092131.1 Zn-ribbon domain-containing OB-fold protein [Nitrososphaerota archaeon]
MSDRGSKIDEFIKLFLNAIEVEKSRRGLPLITDEKTNDPLFFDQRELRLRYLLPIKGIEDFFEGLVKGEVRYTRCKRCGRKYFPPQPDCSSCGTREMEWMRIEGTGELLTFSKVVVKPTSYLHYDDYIVGVARFPEGFNVLAWVRASDVSELEMGTPVRIEVERRQPENYLTYVLVPTKLGD